MSDNSEQYCYNCRFYKPKNEGSGECVRFPPCMKNMETSDRAVGRADLFPTVLNTDWCGEWMGTMKPDIEDPSGTVGEYGGGSTDLMED